MEKIGDINLSSSMNCDYKSKSTVTAFRSKTTSDLERYKNNKEHTSEHKSPTFHWELKYPQGFIETSIS